MERERGGGAGPPAAGVGGAPHAQGAAARQVRHVQVCQRAQRGVQGAVGPAQGQLPLLLALQQHLRSALGIRATGAPRLRGQSRTAGGCSD